MQARERYEQIEEQILSPYAALASRSKGRDREELPCNYRTAFQRDRDRVLHCKSFRRLKHKTQVFLSPEGDHYRTRLTHTLEVSQIARTIARALQLNEDLTEAISLAHDLGHTPFGHAGERALNAVMDGGFRHYEQSVRVVERLENDGRGLNLTYEVRNGIERHTSGEPAQTLEGRIVRLADRVAISITILTTPSGPASCRRRMFRPPSGKRWGTAAPPASIRWLPPSSRTAETISGWIPKPRFTFSSCTPSCLRRSIAIR